MNSMEARIATAYEKLQAEFPFEGYMESAYRLGLDVARVLLDFLPNGGKVLEFGAGACDRRGRRPLPIGPVVWEAENRRTCISGSTRVQL